MVAARVFGKSSLEAIQRENDRLAALQQLDLLDTPRDEGFERIVRLIKEIFSIDIGIVSLIDAHRQWYKACSGLPADEVSREDTFCRYVVDCERPVVVQDATKDSRFSQHPSVTGEDNIRFYAGVPLRTKVGHMIGTVCAIDRRPRSFGNRDLGILEELAGAAMDRIELMQSAAIDSLTEAMTRRAFKQEADQLISLALRHKHDLSCIVFDIDHFKKVNDTHGHAAGDEVLRWWHRPARRPFEPVICSAVLAARNLPSSCRMSIGKVPSPSPRNSEPPSPLRSFAAIMAL
jgi:GAF domain-containing protein